MIGHGLHESILDELNLENKLYVFNDEGKLKTSLVRTEKNVAVIYKKNDSEIYNLSEAERYEINSNRLIGITIGSSLDMSEVYFPDRYFENAPLENRPYIYGIFDCLTLLKDYYRRNFNILLPANLQRNWEWWNNGDNLYIDNAAKYNFFSVKEIQKHDMIVMKINSQVPNHAGVYLGDNKFMHHMGGKFSCIENLNSSYKFRIAIIYRHKDFENAD